MIMIKLTNDHDVDHDQDDSDDDGKDPFFLNDLVGRETDFGHEAIHRSHIFRVSNTPILHIVCHTP